VNFLNNCYMQKNNIILTKSYQFAICIIQLYQKLSSENKEYNLSKQLLRSGTSPGANIEEGLSSQSRKDFISKFSIALKESKEAHYWLRLLRDSNYISQEIANDYLRDCEELIKILTSILKTSRQTNDTKIINYQL